MWPPLGLKKPSGHNQSTTQIVFRGFGCPDLQVCLSVGLSIYGGSGIGIPAESETVPVLWFRRCPVMLVRE